MNKLKFGFFTLFVVVSVVYLLGQAAFAEKKTLSDIQVPTCLSGSITALPAIGVCMDGATHELHTITANPIRLSATTEEVEKSLNKFTDAKVTVSVCGNWVWGPECSYLAVYHVSLLKMEPRAKQFRVIALTASLPAHQGCSVVPEGAVIPMIYSSAYGPASDADCFKWIVNNCDK